MKCRFIFLCKFIHIFLHVHFLMCSVNWIEVELLPPRSVVRRRHEIISIQRIIDMHLTSYPTIRLLSFNNKCKEIDTKLMKIQIYIRVLTTNTVWYFHFVVKIWYVNGWKLRIWIIMDCMWKMIDINFILFCVTCLYWVNIRLNSICIITPTFLIKRKS